MSDSASEFGWSVVVWIVFGLIVYGGVAIYKDYVKPRFEPAKVVIPPAPKCTTDHRFERMEVYPMNLRADIALDSCTGQVCRTWDWAPKGTSETAWTTYESRPLCSDLAKSNP
jgi:hypothetical protein